jgi:hypothetical protein
MRTLVRTRTVTSHMIFTCRKSANSWEIITAFLCAFTGTGHGHGLSYHTTRTYTHNHEQTRASRAVRCWVGARRQQKCRTGGEGASPRLGHPCGPCITILCRRSAAGLVALSVAAVQSTTYVHPYRSSAGVLGKLVFASITLVRPRWRPSVCVRLRSCGEIFAVRALTKR